MQKRLKKKYLKNCIRLYSNYIQIFSYFVTGKMLLCKNCEFKWKTIDLLFHSLTANALCYVEIYTILKLAQCIMLAWLDLILAQKIIMILMQYWNWHNIDIDTILILIQFWCWYNLDIVTILELAQYWYWYNFDIDTISKYWYNFDGNTILKAWLVLILAQCAVLEQEWCKQGRLYILIFIHAVTTVDNWIIFNFFRMKKNKFSQPMSG